MSSITGYVWRRNRDLDSWRKYHRPMWHLVRIESVSSNPGEPWESECGLRFGDDVDYSEDIGPEPVDEYGVCRRCTRALEIANRQVEKAL